MEAGDYQRLLRANQAYAPDGTYGGGGELPHHAHLLGRALELLPEGRGQRAMDVGCGNGFVTARIARRGFRVTGIDFDDKAVAIARAAHPGVDFQVHRAEDRFPEFARDLDLITAFEVIEHLYSPRQFLLNAFEALRPGGHLVLSTPYHGYWKNLAISLLGRWDHVFTVRWQGGHIKFFSEATMRWMLERFGYTGVVFRNAGRFPYLWRTLVVRAQKPPAAAP